MSSKKQSSLSSFFAPKAGSVNNHPIPLNGPPKSVGNTAVSATVKDTKEDGIKGSDHKESNKRNQSSVPPGDVRKKVRRIIDDDDDEEEEIKDTTSKADDTSNLDTKTKNKTGDMDGGLNTDVQPKAEATSSTKNVSSKQETKSSSTLVHVSKQSTLNISSKKPDTKDTKDSTDRVEEGSSLSSSLKGNDPIPYSVLCETFASIEAITSRLEIQKILTRLFRFCLEKSPNDLLPTVYLASNSVAPAYECVELGVGDAILIKAVGEASGTNAATLKSKYEAEGDLGTVAMNAKAKQQTLGFGMKPKPLTVQDVLNAFRQIATTSGSQMQKWKVDKIKGLLVRVQDGREAKYIIRGLQGKLRIGLAQSTVLISLAHAMCLSPPVSGDNKDPAEERLEAAVTIVKKAYSEVPSFDAIIEALLRVPLEKLNETCSLRPGLPVEPMLAKPTKSLQEVLKRLSGQSFTCEFKYDGERAQVHMADDGITKVFSRNLLDTSQKYPEVPSYVKEACSQTNVTSFVLDTEVVAYNRETMQFVPFQILSTRKKTEESEENVKVKIIVQAFDLMFLNGVSLLNRPFAERRNLLIENFTPVEGKFQLASSLDLQEDGNTLLLEEFLENAVKNQCEGLMIKTLHDNATYQPSVRSLNWLKLKKDYLDGMGDSVDLVPLGAYFGRGKRTGVYGAYLLACYDVDTEEFQSVCKIGTGFTDENLKVLHESFKDHTISEKSSQYKVSDALECDVWFDACQVWEIKAADLSKSSAHKGAVDKTGEAGRGIGLRFPRFIRVREDKRPDQATTSDQILEMYYAQDSIVDDGHGNDDDDGI